MASRTGWMPCAVDPVAFSCHDCSIGADAPCRFRYDESLRHERAERFRQFASVVPGDEERAAELVSACVAVLVRQRMALPVVLLRSMAAPDLSSYFDTRTIEVLLRNANEVRETSPGMFKWDPSHHPDSSGLPTEDLSSGAAIARLLDGLPAFVREVQRENLKRLDALRRLRTFASLDEAKASLTAAVDNLAPIVLEREGWRISDAAAFAGNGSLVPVRSPAKEDEQVERRDLLSGILALEIAFETREDPEAEYSNLRRTLLTRNLRLVADVARKYARGGFLQYADLFQAGIEGLDRAIDLYDPYLGYEFSTYATHWIRQAITRSIANEERLVRLPVHTVETLARIRATRTSLRKTLGRTATLDEITQASGLRQRQVVELLERSRPVGRISHLSIAGIPDLRDEIRDAEESFGASAVREILDEFLTAREREVIERRFGLDGDGPQTLEEIGRSFNVTRERVRQIEAKALRKLRARPAPLLLALHRPDATLKRPAARRALPDRESDGSRERNSRV